MNREKEVTTGSVETEEDRNSALYSFAKLFDKAVNVIALILFLLLLLYAGHSIWYTRSLQAGSFLSEELAKFRPDGQKPSLNELKEINDDVISWIRIEGTNIDYPVVQGKDDFEYLNKSVLGEFELSGSIYLSADSKSDFSDPYNMLHGHHVEGGAMFADVIEFRDASFFKKHTKGTLWYPEADGRQRADWIEIFAAVDTSAYDEVIYGEPSKISRRTLGKVTEYILKKAIQKRDVAIENDTRIVGLSTCENAVDMKRVLVFGKLVEMTDAEIKAEQAKFRKEESRKKSGINGFISGLPAWLLPSAGALLLIIIVYLIWRAWRNRQEEKDLKA